MLHDPSVALRDEAGPRYVRKARDYGGVCLSAVRVRFIVRPCVAFVGGAAIKIAAGAYSACCASVARRPESPVVAPEDFDAEVAEILKHVASAARSDGRDAATSPTEPALSVADDVAEEIATLGGSLPSLLVEGSV